MRFFANGEFALVSSCHEHGGPTFWGLTGAALTHDIAVLSDSWNELVKRASVAGKAGRRLLLDFKRRDHFPFIDEIKYAGVSCIYKPDGDKIMGALITGRGRKEINACLESAMREGKHSLQSCYGQSTVGVHWDALAVIIKDVRGDHDCCGEGSQGEGSKWVAGQGPARTVVQSSSSAVWGRVQEDQAGAGVVLLLNEMLQGREPQTGACIQADRCWQDLSVIFHSFKELSYEQRYGRAPPLHQERALQQFLEDMARR